MRHIVLWLLLSLSLLADAVSWRGDYDKAHQEALQSRKPLLVLVVKRGDVLSGEVIRDVFINQPYVKRINAETVPVIVTYGRADYPVEMYYTTVFPALFWVDGKTELFVSKPLYGSKITTERVTQMLENL